MKHIDIKPLLLEQIDPKVAAKEFKEFLLFCKKELKLDQLPKIHWKTKGSVGQDQPSFGAFHNGDQSIHLSIVNRHPLDIMRTLAHELCHYKQYVDGKINNRSGETGSDEENEANAVAGVIMRKWGKANPNMFKNQPIITENTEPVRLKLRGFAAPSSKAVDWINRIRKSYPENPLDSRQTVILQKGDGVVLVELIPSIKVPDAVEIKWIQSHPTKQGLGRLAIERLQKLASQNNITLTLSPSSVSKVPEEKLVNFYTQLGFKPFKADSKSMVWHPDITETKLTTQDSVEKWIEIFKKSTHPKFKNKTPAQREKMARAAHYRAVQNKKTFEGKLLDKKTPTVQELAKKYNCDVDVVKQKVASGIEIELEHTSKRDVAREIALDHLGEDIYYYDKLAKIEKIDEVNIDNEDGWGATPSNRNVDYLGLRVFIKPSVFLKLAAKLDRYYSAADIQQHIQSGGSVGAPFLLVAIPHDWYEGNMKLPAEIYGHEGRNRMTAILKAEGDEPVETHLFFGSGLRNRDLKPEIVERLNKNVIAQSGHLIQGPWFKSIINENSQQPVRKKYSDRVEWELNGKPHRTDGPAIERSDGRREWWVNGQQHRTDGPAVEYANGSLSWWVNGQQHRTDGPAFEGSNGRREWWVNGKRHRTDGPAVIWSDGDREWWVNDQQCNDVVNWLEKTKNNPDRYKKLVIQEILLQVRNENYALTQRLVKKLRQMNIAWPELAVIEDNIAHLKESWSKKYKRSIDCNNPKGFSQKAHCAARRKRAGGEKTQSKPVSENFKDGKGPGRPGDSRRHGIPKNATLAQLDKIGKGSGRKAQLARWQANMRRGRAKVNEKIAPHGGPNDELAMMKAGTKPAALVLDVTFDQLYQPLVKSHGWEVVKFPAGEHTSYAIAQKGDRPRAERIAKLVHDANKSWALGDQVDPEYHRELGKLLGYSDQDIEEFINKIYSKNAQSLKEDDASKQEFINDIIHNPRDILRLKTSDDEIWNNRAIKKSVIKLMLDRLQAESDRQTYAVRVYLHLVKIGCPWPELAVIKQHIENLNLLAPRRLYNYAVSVMARAWPEAEPYILTDPSWACAYANDVLHEPWPQAEPIIQKEPEVAYRYAYDVLYERWPAAEAGIMKIPALALRYARNVVEGPWPEAEPYIIKDPEIAYRYARDVLKHRWPEAEPAIMSDPVRAQQYEKQVPFKEELNETRKAAFARYPHGYVAPAWVAKI